jgi:hypothetical protein
VLSACPRRRSDLLLRTTAEESHSRVRDDGIMF